MTGQNTNHKISACQDLATQLLQILIHVPTIFSSLLCQQGQLEFQSCLRRRRFVRKRFSYYPQKTGQTGSGYSGSAHKSSRFTLGSSSIRLS